MMSKFVELGVEVGRKATKGLKPIDFVSLTAYNCLRVTQKLRTLRGMWCIYEVANGLGIVPVIQKLIVKTVFAVHRLNIHVI